MRQNMLFFKGMKKLFTVIFAILAAASIYSCKTLPGAITDRPVLYWVTDSNPARNEQIRTFKNWLKKNHPDAPDVTVLVDTANVSAEKILIQGISGVCGDLIDHSGGPALRFRKSVGILEDVTESAKEMGFDLSQTFPAAASELVAPVKVTNEDGSTGYEMRQFAFPCNITVEMLWVNKEAFENAGMDLPPKRWTLEDFERIGKEFVTKSNKKGELQRIFFIADVKPQLIASSMGGAIFNETQTASVANSEAMRKAMELRLKWMTEEPRLLPTATERNSFSASSGYGGAGVAMFTQGNYALLNSGRYMLIQYRKISDERVAAGGKRLQLAVVEQPYGEMPIASTFTRATAIYAGGKHSEAKNPDDKSKQLARYFLAFLASDDYNMNIVRDADAMPPNPKYTELEEFNHPKDYPDEWGNHEMFPKAMREIAVPQESTPFGVDNEINRLIGKAFDYHLNRRKSAEESLIELHEQINAEIKRSLQEDPDLDTLYKERIATQKKIDELRAKGEKVPLSWISNPFWRKWYQHQGWADVEK